MGRIATLALGLVLCAGTVYADKVQKEGKAWLARFTEPPAINVNGEWESPDWGTVKLVQAEGSREVTGTGDGWRIDGVVSGRKVYLLFSDHGQVNYCAELEAESEASLRGDYSNGMMKPKSKTRPMHLTK